jgi:hypothetical protein
MLAGGRQMRRKSRFTIYALRGNPERHFGQSRLAKGAEQG